jgi:hypothetical protein
MPRCSFILLGLMIISGTCHAADVSCIDSNIAEIRGLIPDTKPSEEMLKNHLSVESVSGENDGGGYQGKRYIFNDYEVTVVRGKIDSISITSPNILWLGRIRLGTGRSEIERWLAPYRVYGDDTSSQYLVCSSYGDVYAILYYEQGRLKRVEFLIDRP